MPFAEVALGAGFASIRQFNDTIRAVFATSPTEMRTRSRHRGSASTPGAIELRLARRSPFDGDGLLAFLGGRAAVGPRELRRHDVPSLAAPAAWAGAVELTPADGYVHCRLHLDDVRDLAAAVQRCRRMLDLDADPVAIADQLSGTPCSPSRC